MKGQEARALTEEKFNAELADLRGKLFSFRTQTVTEKVEDNSQFKKIRRDIARLMTVQTERRNAGTPKTTRRAPVAAVKPVKQSKPKAPAAKRSGPRPALAGKGKK